MCTVLKSLPGFPFCTDMGHAVSLLMKSKGRVFSLSNASDTITTNGFT